MSCRTPRRRLCCARWGAAAAWTRCAGHSILWRSRYAARSFAMWGRCRDEYCGRRRGAGFRNARQQWPHGQHDVAARQAVPAVFLPEGGYAGLHQGSLCIPGSAAAAWQNRHRRYWRVAGQDEADREVCREVRADVPAGVRRRPCGGREVRHLGGEVDVWTEVYGDGAELVPGGQGWEDRQGVAEGERDGTRRGCAGCGEGAEVGGSLAAPLFAEGKCNRRTRRAR